jgi:GntR family transcriptional repressor for pyruvate dehydrogenase complex
LAAKFDVSRPTIREAIIALEIGGLVEVRVGSGVYVVSKSGDRMTPAELDIGPFELLEARRMIESDMAAVAAARISDMHLARLDQLLGEMAHENEIGAVGERADREFHNVIAEGTGNSALVSTVEHLWSVRETSPMLITMLNKARAYGVKPMIEDHERIVNALRERDPDAAHAAMHGHLSRVIDALLEASEAESVERARNEAAALRAKYQKGNR